MLNVASGMKISIAMATYNGARYLKEQLDSFLWQTHPPDELVVTDDGSSDETLTILEKFAIKAPFKVTVFKNEVRLGYAQNFAKALSLCSGDLIFLSDQDDIWFKEKIEVIARYAREYPDKFLLMNDAELALADGTPLGLTMLGQTLSLGLGRDEFTTGCCMAIRRPFLRAVLPVPSEERAHDTWINSLALKLDAKLVVSCVLQYYRRHGANTSSWIASRTVRQDLVDLILFYSSKDPRPFALERLAHLSRIERRLNAVSTVFDEVGVLKDRLPLAIERVAEERDAVMRRIEILDKPRWRRWWCASSFLFHGHYRHFSGWKSWIKDMVRR